MDNEGAHSSHLSDEGSRDASSELMEDAGLDADMLEDEGENKCYPSDEYLMLFQQVTQLRASPSIWSLLPCLKTTHSILSQQGRRRRQADMDCVRRFFREDLYISLEKVLNTPARVNVRHPETAEILMETLVYVVLVAAHALTQRAEINLADLTPDLDSDLLPVAQCLLNLFNFRKPLLAILAEEELPAMSDQLNQLAEAMTEDYAHPMFHPEQDDLDETEEQQEPASERHRWLVYLINLFGHLHGFKSIIQLLQQPVTVGFSLLNMMTAVLAQVADHATVGAKDEFNQVVPTIMDHLTELVEADSDRLSDFGADKTYNCFNCLVNINLPCIIRNGQHAQETSMQLQHIHCRFVVKLLESSSFNKLLTGVRECNRMLSRAAQGKQQDQQDTEQLQVLVAWMHQEDIVQRILRTNLHQRQYMQEVQGIMVTLTVHHFLAPEHLDMLWAVTEKEDTYEAVKTHMFDLLAEIASKFGPSQLDMLFAKLKQARERSTQDTQRLLGLLQHLAQNDSEVNMSEKITSMVWDLTIPATTQPNVEGPVALQNVLRAYRKHKEKREGMQYVFEWLVKCFNALIEGKGGQVPLLRSLRRILDLLPAADQDKRIITQEKACDALADKYDFMTKLVDRICSKVAAACDAVAAAQAEAAAAAAGQATATADGAAVTAIKQAAIELLGEGGWSYTDIIKEHVMTLRMYAITSSSYFNSNLAERLWDTLMVNPPYHEDVLPQTQAFFKAGFQGSDHSGGPFFEGTTQQALLEKHMVLQDGSKVGLSATRLFMDIFQQVNLESKAIELAATKQMRYVQADDLEQIKGLDFLWQVYLRNADEKVANFVKNHLIYLFHCPSLRVVSEPYKQAFVKRIASALQNVAPALDGKDEAAEMAARVVARCLKLCLSALEFINMATMPPVPEHRFSWRGTPLMLDIQRDGAARMKLNSHSNEYVGLLRERVAKQIGCPSKHVRIMCLGRELTVDAEALSAAWDSRSRAVMSAAVSPEPNRYTLAPDDFREVYNSVALSWMLSQAESIYPLLLRFIDMPNTAEGSALPQMALSLLLRLPTCGALSQRLAAALDGADKHQMLALALDPSSSSMDEDPAADPKQADAAIAAVGDPPTPYQTLYALQSLCALLFPTFDDSLFGDMPADAEAVAEASACASPADGSAPGSTTALPAAVAALQQRQHCEAQQQEFLHCRGLEIVLEAVHKAAITCSGDVKIRRQLSELVVVFLHNLVDAASSWIQPLDSLGLQEGISGAESGAVAAAAAVAAPADSGVAAMAGVQQPGDDGDSSALDGNNAIDADVQQHASTGEQLRPPAQQQQQQPGSPLMEDAADTPQPTVAQQQRQQQSKQLRQRQRGGDLPPLPPAASQGNGSVAAAQPATAFAATFGSHALKLMSETLLDVAVETSQLYGAGSLASLTRDDVETDIAVVRDALQLLLRLLEQHPALVQSLLLDMEQSPLVTVVLVNPHYPPLRRQAAEFLDRLVSSEAHVRMLPWLLQQLAAARSIAQNSPASCHEFYELLASVVLRMGKAWGSLPSHLFVLANQMLDEEVAALKAAAAAASPLATDNGHRRAAAEAACTLLQGRLQLVLALVRILDRRAVGSDSHGGLIRHLLQDFLFPEAVQLSATDAKQLDLANVADRIEPRCATPTCRKAALELLAELMGDTPSSLEEGVGLLIDLHYQRQPLHSWNIMPKALRQPGQYMGLKNGGATCYMNAVFQQLFMQPDIRAGVLGAQAVSPKEAIDNVFAQLQRMFAMMTLGKGTFHIPRDFWAAFKDYDGTPIDVKEHQDAYEFFTRLQDFVDQHLISSSQKPAIKPVMGGKFVQQIICRGHNFTSEREEDFYQISVDVKGMESLEKSLDDYVKGELMEGDNAYMCEELGKRVPAVKRAAIKALPQMLCIHLKRFEFDYHNQTRYKVRDRFEFPVEIDMFPYTADGLAAADQQQKVAEQQQQQQTSGDGALNRQLDGSSSGAGGNSSSGGAELRRQLSDAVQQALSAKRTAGGYVYDLMGVVVHSGSAFTGHYYSYIKERSSSQSAAAAAGAAAAGSNSSGQSRQGQWYCFDDKSVTAWDVSNLEPECFGGKASQDSDSRVRPSRNEYERAHSAYMLFYERRQAPPTAAAVTVPVEEQDLPMAAAVASISVSGDGSSAHSLELGAILSPGFKPPYNMPLSLYKSVMDNNILLMWQQHVLDKDYFKFVRQLVESRGDLGQLSHRKARKREGSAPPTGGTAAAATPSGSSGGRIHSSMSCDVPAGTQACGTSNAQQQRQHQQPQVVVDGADAVAVASGAASPCPMAVSPAPATITAGASIAKALAGESTADGAAAGGNSNATAGNANSIVPPPVMAPSELQVSPSPSSRRGEEAEAVAQVLLRLGVLFQFQVYLRAHDSLRSESNVWTEALMGMMGSGPTSTSCLQVFLELQLAHAGSWMREYLLDIENVVPFAPKRWAADMLGWVLETAAKRCSRSLASYVSQWLQCHSMMASCGAGSAAGGAQETYREAFIALRQQQPPLVQAVLAFVEQVADMIRSCIPNRHAGCSGSAAAALLGQDVVDIPADAARVLQRYAALGPWAAAHLMQVLQIVPDLAEIVSSAVAATEPDEDAAMEDLVFVYELILELISHASNLHILAAAMDQVPTQHQRPNPFTRSSSAAGMASSSSSNTDQQQQAASSSTSAAVAAVVQLSSPIVLPLNAYRMLLTENFLRGLTCIHCASSPSVVALANMLSWNSLTAGVKIMQRAQAALHKAICLQPAESTAGKQWEQLKRNWSMMVLLPDSLLADRVLYFLMGSYTPMYNGRVVPGALVDMNWSQPGLAAWLRDKAVCLPCMNFFCFVHLLIDELRDAQGPVDYKKSVQLLLHRIWEIKHVQSGGVQLYQHIKDNADFRDELEQVQGVLVEAQTIYKRSVVQTQANAAAAPQPTPDTRAGTQSQ